MGNEQSGPRRDVPLPRLSRSDYERFEGDRFVIFPHLVDDLATIPPADVDANIHAQEGAEEGEGERASDDDDDEEEQENDPTPVEGHDDASIPSPPPFDPRGVRPSWQHMMSVLQREIPDLEALGQAFADMKPGPVPLVVGLQAVFVAEPGFEARFFSVILPAIQRLALRLPDVFPADARLPLLVPGHDGEVTLTQEQCGVLLASGFMGTLWVHPGVWARHKFPGFKIQNLLINRYGPTFAFLRMLLNYFERLSIQVPEGKVTFRRQVLTQPPDWGASAKPLLPAQVANQGKIEDAQTSLHADFANQYIGGGVLSGGCVQEEILFAIKPECLVSMLFCAKMNDNEVIFITGAERFSDYSGYGPEVAFAGNHVDQTPRDEQGRITTTIVAIDAVVAYGGLQWQESSILRDLNKVYCACWEPHLVPGQALAPFATGNWGCGAFGGDKSLKVLQQMMAASEAGRELLYHTFGERYGSRSLKEWIGLVNEVILKHHPTVGEVYRLVKTHVPERGGHNVNLFALLLQHYQHHQHQQQPHKDEASAHHESRP